MSDAVRFSARLAPRQPAAEVTRGITLSALLRRHTDDTTLAFEVAARAAHAMATHDARAANEVEDIIAARMPTLPIPERCELARAIVARWREEEERIAC